MLSPRHAKSHVLLFKFGLNFLINNASKTGKNRRLSQKYSILQELRRESKLGDLLWAEPIMGKYATFIPMLGHSFHQRAVCHANIRVIWGDTITFRAAELIYNMAPEPIWKISFWQIILHQYIRSFLTFIVN